MTLLGIRLTILAGKTIPTPPPRAITESISSVTVTHSDEERSGFQIVFQAGRDRANFLDFPQLTNNQFKPNSRVQILVTLGVMPQVLIDGFITDQQLSPSTGAGGSTVTVIGEDISIKMDQKEKNEEHTGLSDDKIATAIIGQYAQYGLVPKVVKPASFDVPNPSERTPTQQATDLKYLKAIAKRHGYIFHIIPGPAPGVNTAYWGPSIRQGVPQKALSHNLGIHSNVDSLKFRYEALKRKTVAGKVQDKFTNQTLPVISLSSLLSNLSSNPPDVTDLLTGRRETYRSKGKSLAQAYAEAQARADETNRDVVLAEGELNALRYGGILQARALVGVRGVGLSYSGNYTVKNVTHTITTKAYKQKFTLAREGLGSATPLVKT
ncbi:MAG: hypothetical protein AAFV85_17895 [Cyanobacteria bacterium J06634_6]